MKWLFYFNAENPQGGTEGYLRPHPKICTWAYIPVILVQLTLHL